MSEDSPVTSNGVFVFLQLYSCFWIWRDFQIESLIYMQICIHQGGGRPNSISIFLIRKPMVDLPVALHRAILNVLDRFPLRRIVYIVVLFDIFFRILFIFVTALSSRLVMVLMVLQLVFIRSDLAQVVLTAILLQFMIPKSRKERHLNLSTSFHLF